jgi:hypothetical protein
MSTARNVNTYGGTLNFDALPLSAFPVNSRWHFGHYNLVPGTTTVTITGWATTNTTQLGSGASAALSNTNTFSRKPRFQATSSASAGNFAGIYNINTNAFFVGDGGFWFGWSGGSADAATVAQARCFYGMRNATASPANADPSSYVDILGFGADSGESELSFMHNDSSGTATKVQLNGGSGFPAHTLSADWYEWQIMRLPGASEVLWWIKNISTGVTTSGNVNTNIPTSGTYLGPCYFRNNGSTALAVRLCNGNFSWATNLED